jgi:uncharacterized protein YwgA
MIFYEFLKFVIMIGKLIITAIILGGGAFLLLSDSFEEYIGPYASAAASDIENLKNDPIVQDKINQVIEVIYEKFISLKLSLSDFF